MGYILFLQILRENGRLEVVGTAHTSVGVRLLVKSVVGGLRAWQQPEAATEGLGGTYFFLDETGEKTAIVKPCDEEPLAPNNPKVRLRNHEMCMYTYMYKTFEEESISCTMLVSIILELPGSSNERI